MSADELAWRVPRHLDEPIMFGPLTGGEMAIIFAAVMLGILSKMVFTALPVAIGLVYGNKRLRTRYGKGWAVQFYYFFSMERVGAAPPSWMRVLRG